MDIKKKLREELLKEEKKAKYEKACTMVYLNINKTKWKEIQDVIKDEDLYVGTEKDGDMYGREIEQHVTVLYGTDLDVEDWYVEELISKFTKPDIKFKSISMFETKNGYDVVKFDIESEKLTKYNKMLKTLPYTSDFPGYKPHVTVAYVKKGLAKKYVKLLEHYKITDKDFKLSDFVYSKQGHKKYFKIK